MTLTDVPTSGIYLQKGAITQLVVQLIDYVTGEPIQLQTATGLSISILYPDTVTAQTFTATLYTDGSDGRISYVTKSDGSTEDLSQVGLYTMQGGAFIGGVAVPPNYPTDFYVLPNVMGSSLPPAAYTPSTIILLDSNSVRWGGTVSPSGVVSFAALSALPSSFLLYNSLVMQDAAGVYWSVVINTSGALQNVPGGTFPSALQNFTLSDINGKSWIIKISEDGVLAAS